MKIVYTLPSIDVPHGGYRIVIEHLTRLQAFGHATALFVEFGRLDASWYGPVNFEITKNRGVLKESDIIVIGSPHSIWIETIVSKTQKCFVFMQMAEHKFRPNDVAFGRLCKKFYNTHFPIIHGSRWGERFIRSGITHYIGNGVNLHHFPISTKPKDGKTVLIEGWEASNQAKDIDRISPKVAERLKRDGYRILAYGFHPIKTLTDVPDEYYCRPDLDTMNRLYEEATILVKATRYDARALSPMEGMTKGTVTVRALCEGDDDLIAGFNACRVGYNENDLYEAASAILHDTVSRERLAANCLKYVQENTWDKIIEQLNNILCS